MSTSPSTRPLVLVTTCNRMMGEHPFHVVGQKYVDAVRLAGALPFISPPLDAAEIEAVLDQVHGVLLTGSPSMVHPGHFDESLHDDQLLLDTQRDAWTLPLIRRTLARGVPLLGICRGTQEVNVALGGSLHQAIQEQPGLADHRAADGQPAAVQYADVHPVTVAAGSQLAAITGRSTFQVNSLHSQGVKRLAPGLKVEATAPDGVVEAFSWPSAPAFNLCVQWHPEWQAAGNPVSMALLRAFGDAVRAYRDRPRALLPDSGQH
jgi:putative glutamine amidotransferase